MNGYIVPGRRLRTLGLGVLAVLLGSVISAGQTKSKATLEVRDLVDSTAAVRHLVKDREGERYFVGDTVFFSRADLQSIEAGRNPEGAGGVLNFTWNSSAVERWKEYTGSRVGKRIAIIANGELLAAPKILDRIENPGIMLSLPDTDMNKARRLAAELTPGP